MKAIFLRALEEKEDKDLVLRNAIEMPKQAIGRTRFEVDPESFLQIPRSPFSYWASPNVRGLFVRLPALESAQRCARQGGVPGDDFRRLRLRWELPSAAGVGWFCYAKGGEFSRFYSALHLAVRWDASKNSFHAFSGLTHRPSLQPASSDFYFRPGLTWSRRTQGGLSFRAMPSRCIFAGKGPAAFVLGDEPPALLALLAIVNSRPFRLLVDLQMAFGSYEVGVLQRTPVPELSESDGERLEQLARASWSVTRSLDTPTENSHAFHLPAVLQSAGESLAHRASAWSRRVAAAKVAFANLQSEIDDRCFELYGIAEEEREQTGDSNTAILTNEEGREDDADEEDSDLEALDPGPLVASLFSWAVGVAFGRFDLRLASVERNIPPEPGPFDPLPTCSPGMLTGEGGLPLDEPPEGYPIDFPRDGILIEDAGMERDLVTCVARVFDHIFEDPAARWEEAAEILGEQDRTLRSWTSLSFFALHLRRYSKSRRRAPIYWPLATASGSYAVWVYYPRLTADTLYQVVSDHLEPKLRRVQAERVRVEASQGRSESREAAQLTKEAGQLAALEQELEEMRIELLRIAQLPYKPDHNDGVQITAAPLWKLFRLPVWRTVLEETWKKLENGEYDWAHLAYAIWPERVISKCARDRSLAIAHGLEADFWAEGADGKWEPKAGSEKNALRLAAKDNP